MCSVLDVSDIYLTKIISRCSNDVFYRGVYKLTHITPMHSCLHRLNGAQCTRLYSLFPLMNSELIILLYMQ